MLTLIDMANLILRETKKKPGLVTFKFKERLYQSMMTKNNVNLFFYRCCDVIYVMQLLSTIRYVASQKDFWLKCEDMLMRMKRDLSLE